MTTYVLVGGAWLGGWAWQPVTRQLRQHGHDVHPVTLTGLGERSHLATPEVDLDTYLADVVDLIEAEDLHEVVLVGHSYAGLVVTGVADRIPERIALLAYLDAGAGGSPCRPGRSWRASWAPASRVSAPTSATTSGPTPPPSRSAPGPSPCRSGTRPASGSPSS